MNPAENLTQRPEGAKDAKAVLFLDVDGVLNCAETKERIRGFIGIEPAKASLVKKILCETGARLVVSSTWRKHGWTLAHLLEQLGIGEEEVDRTPVSTDLISRGGEIDAWLKDHSEVTRFVILDDDSRWCSQFPELAKQLVKTSPFIGITEEIALQVINRLKAEVPA